MNSFTVTAEEHARWPEETKVLFDRFHEFGNAREVTPGEVAWCLRDAESWCDGYRMEYAEREENPLALNASAYSNWATSSISAGEPFSLDTIKHALRMHEHRHCPLYRCEEDSHQQTMVPVHERFVEFYGVDQGYEQRSVWLVDWSARYIAEPAMIWPPGEAMLYSGSLDGDYRHVVRITNIATDTEGRLAPKPDPHPRSKVPRMVRERQPRLDGRRR